MPPGTDDPCPDADLRHHPTTVRTKVWLGVGQRTGELEVTAQDSFAGLQAPGAVGLTTVISGSATNAPVTVSVLDVDRAGRSQ